MTEPLDLGPPLRAALCDAPGIGDEIEQWSGEPAVFTRRPIPDGAPELLIIVNPDSSLTDFDALKSDRPIITRDIAIFGDKVRHYRQVEAIGYRVRELFHRKRHAIAPGGYDVVDIICRGPTPGPTDDDQTVARVVGLTVRLRRKL